MVFVPMSRNGIQEGALRSAREVVHTLGALQSTNGLYPAVCTIFGRRTAREQEKRTLMRKTIFFGVVCQRLQMFLGLKYKRILASAPLKGV